MSALEHALIESSLGLWDAETDEERYRAVARALAVKLLIVCIVLPETRVTSLLREEAVNALEFTR